MIIIRIPTSMPYWFWNYGNMEVNIRMFLDFEKNWNHTLWRILTRSLDCLGKPSAFLLVTASNFLMVFSLCTHKHHFLSLNNSSNTLDKERRKTLLCFTKNEHTESQRRQWKSANSISIIYFCTSFEGFIPMILQTVLFLIVISGSLVGGYQCYIGTC
jgi:hypothetical protein